MKPVEFVVCISTADFGDFSETNLVLGKRHEQLAREGDWLRIVDESGEGDLYPDAWFVPVALSAGNRSLSLPAGGGWRI